MTAEPAGPQAQRPARRHVGLLIALVIAGAAVFLQHRRFDDPHIVYDRFSLPGFDAYVYVAMAENPAFFTVAPWGYRILTPALVHGIGGRNVVRGFRSVTLGALTAAGGLLFLYLRRLGHGERSSFLAVAAFGFSAPVAEAVRYPFLSEPLSIALTLAFLLALESGAGLGVLSLLMVVGSLSKEFFFFYIPLVALAALPRRGWRRAVIAAVVVPTPALVAALILRGWWAPLPPAGQGMLAIASDPAAIRLVVDSWSTWWRPLMLGGLLPLAVLGCLRRTARPFLFRYGYLVAGFLLLPLAAAVYPGEARVINFFAADVPRLLIYALPFLIPLALLGLDWVVPHVGVPPPRVVLRPLAEWVAFPAAFAVAGVLPLILDSYGRIDLRGPRDGPLVLALCRESLRTARRLERGETVTFDLATQRFVWGESDPGEMGRMRWFLGEGWGDKPHYRGEPYARMASGRASILLPVLEPRDLEVSVVVDAPQSDRLSLLVNDRPLPGGMRRNTPPIRDDPSRPEAVRVEVPAGVLRRGDNLLMLITDATDVPALRMLVVSSAKRSEGPGEQR